MSGALQPGAASHMGLEPAQHCRTASAGMSVRQVSARLALSHMGKGYRDYCKTSWLDTIKGEPKVSENGAQLLWRERPLFFQFSALDLRIIICKQDAWLPEKKFRCCSIKN